MYYYMRERPFFNSLPANDLQQISFTQISIVKVIRDENQSAKCPKILISA